MENNSEKLIEGLIVGSRKAGTSWLYENFKLEADIFTSDKVKESGFFAKELVSKSDIDSYKKLYPSGVGFRVEVDSSVCYSDNALENINKYASGIPLVLILREPVEYLVSRYEHSLRKGEIKEENYEQAILNNRWLFDELDYSRIMSRFSSHEKMLYLPYELLKVDDIEFYKKIVNFMVNDDVGRLPKMTNRVNESRKSKLPLVSMFLSAAAKFSRKLHLHSLVNLAKNTGVLGLLEEKNSEGDLERKRMQAETVVNKYFGESLQIWKELNERHL